MSTSCGASMEGAGACGGVGLREGGRAGEDAEE